MSQPSSEEHLHSLEAGETVDVEVQHPVLDPRCHRDRARKLYGFTSDASGIRHPILDEPNIGEEDARFFIVACSALVNWVIAKADKAGLLKKA